MVCCVCVVVCVCCVCVSGEAAALEQHRGGCIYVAASTSTSKLTYARTKITQPLISHHHRALVLHSKGREELMFLHSRWCLCRTRAPLLLVQASWWVSLGVFVCVSELLLIYL